MKPPLVPKLEAERSVEPSGFRIEIFADEQHEVPIVTSESLRLIRWPAAPSKTSRASSPGDVVVTVTGSPPGTMAGAEGRGARNRARVRAPHGGRGRDELDRAAAVGVKLPV